MDTSTNSKIKLWMLLLIMFLCFFAGYITTSILAWKQAGDYYERTYERNCIIPREYEPFNPTIPEFFHIRIGEREEKNIT